MLSHHFFICFLLLLLLFLIILIRILCENIVFAFHPVTAVAAANEDELP